MRNISKTFPGMKALRGVELTVYPGEVHALMGENGAGKSTLMKILAGAQRADAGGEIRLRGVPAQISGPRAARAHGIAIIYQELALALNLTVAENIYLGHEVARGGVLNRHAMSQGCVAVLQRLGAKFGPETLVGALSIAERQLVEIARAIHARSRILIMDEPTTALSSRETDRLFELIRELRADGMAIIYISHRMAEVYQLADRVSVLRDGLAAGVLFKSEINAETLVRMMVGRDLSSFYKKEHRPDSQGAPLLQVRNMTDQHRVRGCALTVHAGEVLGLAGMVGSGRTELARLIYGADRCIAGEVTMAGQALRSSGPQQSIDAGLDYLTEDRGALGLFLDMTVADNINIEVVGRDARPGGVLDRPRGLARAAEAIGSMGIRAASALVGVGSLSGGNQQKVLLSRLLQARPKVLLLDEPTRGVDIGAKSEIYRIIDDLAKSGVGILVISSELAEIVGICDRVLVMREGQIAGELAANGITQEAIVALATGAHETPRH